MNIKFEKEIGQKIREIREKKGFTQDYIATQFQLNDCDITRSAIAKIEVGQRHIYPDELLLFKKILDCTFDEIFDND